MSKRKRLKRYRAYGLIDPDVPLETYARNGIERLIGCRFTSDIYENAKGPLLIKSM